MYKPPSVTVFDWLRKNLGKRALGVLTDTDTRALRAAVQIVECYCYSDSLHRPRLAQAFGAVVTTMQPQSRRLAYHAIAHVWDWSYRSDLWVAAQLLSPEGVGRCAFEPGGSMVEYQP